MNFLIAAGHNNTDPGNIWNGRKESVIVTDLRDIVASKLRAKGHTVVTDGERGINWALSTAMGLIAGRVAIELHTNSASSTFAKGVEVISQPKDKQLACLIASKIAGVLNTNIRRASGWLDPKLVEKERGFFPGFVRKGGLIVEVFFQSNISELETYEAKKWLVAQAIVDSLTGD